MHLTLHRLGTLSDGGERDGGPPEAVDVLLSQLGSTGDQSNTVMIEENNDIFSSLHYP